MRSVARDYPYVYPPRRQSEPVPLILSQITNVIAFAERYRPQMVDDLLRLHQAAAQQWHQTGRIA